MKTQVFNVNGPSSYLGGGFRAYGLYQWCIKFYGFESDFEIEDARDWAFGEYIKMKRGNGRHFENLSQVIGREVEASIEGRSGGWLVIHEELTQDEISKVTEHVKACLEGLPGFLSEERQLKIDLQKESEEIEAKTKTALESDERMQKAISLIREVVGADAVVYAKGIRLL